MPEGDNIRILVVEDEPDTASVLKTLLKLNLGADVVVASDCASAREALPAEKPDIITLDYQLPDGDGLSLLREINSLDDPPPVVMVTGHGDERTAVEAFKRGAAGYVVKDRRMSTLLVEEVKSAMTLIQLHRAELALRKSEEKYHAIFNNITEGIIESTPDGRCVAVNPALASMLGYASPEQMMGEVTDIGSQFHVDSGDWPRILDRLEGNCQVRGYEAMGRRRDGETIWVSISAKAVRDADGKILFVDELIEDITERRLADEALRFEREQLLSIFDSIGHPVYVTDTDTCEVLFVNRALREILPGGDPVGGVCHKVFQGLDERCEFCTNDIITANRGEPHRWEYYNPVVDRHYMLTDRLITWPDGRDVRLEVALDISDLKKAERDLELRNTELSGYAQTVSHGLKGPLASISTAAGLIGEAGGGGPDAPDLGELSELILTSAGKASDRVDALLALAKAGREPSETEYVEVGGVVAELLQEMSLELDGRGAEVEVDENLGTVCANRLHVYQVFSNLLYNAVKHGGDGSLIVEVRYLGSGAGLHRYLVRDNGPGLPEGAIAELFKPFFKGDHSGESGIGLAIVDKIVRLYGGEIRAYNDGGACFEFSLVDCSPPATAGD